jgi:FdhE protein
MLWPTARRRLDAAVADRLAHVRRHNPESGVWLALIEAALLQTADAGRWRAGLSAPAPSRPAGAPLLHGTELVVDARAARQFIGRLTKLAGLNGDAPDPRAATELLAAAVCQDDARIAELARGDPVLLRVVAQIAAIPLLVTTAATLREAVPAAWSEGYCPVCGAWPTRAEFRGIERQRWLRCGRCATAWEIAWLRCAFCGETNHTHLGYLSPDNAETRKVEVCLTCNGYLKAQSTVSAEPWWGVVLDDAATVALDVAALDRGYHRPDRPGFDLEVRVVAHRRGLWTR